MIVLDHFRVMVVDLCTGQGNVVELDGRGEFCGGSGLAGLLFEKYGLVDQPWDDPAQPLIFAVGPLTGLFPLMSKTVCAFKSPYHDQYAESHAGGRSAFTLKYAGYDALVITGRAKTPKVLHLGDKCLELHDAHWLWGMDVFKAGKHIRKMFPGSSGHRSIMRIGPAGENCSSMACINVDSFRHFGRLGSGGVMGSKNLKGIVITGNGIFDAPGGKKYPKLFAHVHELLTETSRMEKYHNLGTAGNVALLNELKSLPWRNLQQTSDPAVGGITGETFAEKTLLRNQACSGCPVGCIHIGYVRERFQEDNRWLYRQVGYDFELIFAVGSMLGVTNAFSSLKIMDQVEKVGLDIMGTGVALAWATEALEKGIITEEETLGPLSFGDGPGYERAVGHMGAASNEFYRVLAQGLPKTVEAYGGEDFACVLGQEMAGYATGEVFFVSQALGFRHAHLDSGGYAWDQKNEQQDVEGAVEFLVSDGRSRSLLTSMVACLFSRGVYSDELVAEALTCVGHGGLADNVELMAGNIQRIRWRNRFATGYDPDMVKIPKRFLEVETWKGKIDPVYMEAVKKAYAKRIKELGRSLPEQ